jgi:hypothetical protein
MANKAIVYIDLLGVQKMWKQGGAPAVKARIAEFNAFVTNQVNYLPSYLHREGEYTLILAGDSVSVMCQDFDQAIGIGEHIFVQAFYASRDVTQPFWLRGAIASWHNQYLTLNTHPIQAKGMQIGTQYVNEDDYLAVLAMEKSGFRGMRLVVDRDVLANYGLGYQRQWDGFTRPLGYVTQLKQCTYPHRGNYGDVLWMTSSEEQYGRLKGIMANRFKLSTHDADEFIQASWTRAVFDQVESIVWGCKQTDRREDTEQQDGQVSSEAAPDAALEEPSS